MELTLRVAESDADLEAWRRVRLAVVPFERCDTVGQLRGSVARGGRLLLLAERPAAAGDTGGETAGDAGGVVLVGHGSAGPSNSEGVGSIAPRILPAERRRGAGSAILRRLCAHLADAGYGAVRATADDPEAVGFAERQGFREVDRQVEQLRAIGTEPHPGTPPAGVEVVLAADRPDLWAGCYDTFGLEAVGDFATHRPMTVTREQWVQEWPGDPMYLAVERGTDGERVVGCAGLERDTDVPDRAEYALTAVARDRRGCGIAAYLKELTLNFAAVHGIREVYTWTQRGNDAMRGLNVRLGFRYGIESLTVSRRLPLD